MASLKGPHAVAHDVDRSIVALKPTARGVCLCMVMESFVYFEILSMNIIHEKKQNKTTTTKHKTYPVVLRLGINGYFRFKSCIFIMSFGKVQCLTLSINTYN